MTFTAGDISEALAEGKGRYDNDEYEIDSSEFFSELRWGSSHLTVTLGDTTYPVKEVAHQGGGEGQGENVWLVFEVDGRLFKTTGFYMSYDGTTWDGDVTEVKPVQKVVTVFE